MVGQKPRPQKLSETTNRATPNQGWVGPVLSTTSRIPSITELADVFCSRALLTLHHIELNPLALGQRFESAALDGRVVYETILLAVFRCDEAKALCVVEPLHCTGGTHLPYSPYSVERSESGAAVPADYAMLRGLSSPTLGCLHELPATRVSYRSGPKKEDPHANQVLDQVTCCCSKRYPHRHAVSKGSKRLAVSGLAGTEPLQKVAFFCRETADSTRSDLIQDPIEFLLVDRVHPVTVDPLPALDVRTVTD